MTIFVSGMISKDELVKRDVLTLLSTLTLHSSTAYKYVTEAFDHFKVRLVEVSGKVATNSVHTEMFILYS